MDLPTLVYLSPDVVIDMKNSYLEEVLKPLTCFTDFLLQRVAESEKKKTKQKIFKLKNYI
jgi:hypothetical protein